MNTRILAGSRVRLIILTLVLILVFVLLYLLRSAVFPFALGLILAYILLPLVSWTERHLPFHNRSVQSRRITAIVLIFIFILLLIAALSFYFIATLIDPLTVLINNAPDYISSALKKFNELAPLLSRLYPNQTQLDALLGDIGNSVGNAIKDTFIKGIALIPASLGFILGFAALPLFLFYTLKDWTRLKDGFYSRLPEWAVPHARNILSIIAVVLGQYIRAQLFLGLVVGVMNLVGLLILRVPYAPVLALIAGAAEIVPTLGPWIGGVTAVIVTLAAAPEKAIWVAVLMVIVQLLENNLLVPRIQGANLKIHPAIAIFLLVMGNYIAGFWGLVLSLPLTAIVVRLYGYFYNAGKEGAKESP